MVSDGTFRSSPSRRYYSLFVGALLLYSGILPATPCNPSSRKESDDNTTIDVKTDRSNQSGKSTGFHLVELHLQSVGLSLVSVVVILVVSCLLFACYKRCCGLRAMEKMFKRSSVPPPPPVTQPLWQPWRDSPGFPSVAYHPGANHVTFPGKMLGQDLPLAMGPNLALSQEFLHQPLDAHRFKELPQSMMRRVKKPKHSKSSGDPPKKTNATKSDRPSIYDSSDDENDGTPH